MRNSGQNELEVTVQNEMSNVIDNDECLSGSKSDTGKSIPVDVSVHNDIYTACNVPDQTNNDTVNDQPTKSVHVNCDKGKKGARVNTAGSQYLGNYVSVQIQNSKFFAMVDSGAEISCVNPELLLKHAQLKNVNMHSPDREYIETATGDRTSIQGMVFLRTKIEGHTVLCKFYVVPNVQPQLILGQDFLCQNNVNVQFGKGGMSISMNPVRQVVSTSPVIVPPNSQVAMLARIKGSPLPNEVTGLTSGSHLLTSLGLVTTKSLSMNKMGSVQFACANFSDESIEIPKGAMLGKFSCLSINDGLYTIPDGDDDIPEGESKDHESPVSCTDTLETINSDLTYIYPHEIEV